MQTCVYYSEQLQATCRKDYSSATELKKSAGRLLSDFYGHWVWFNIRSALSVLKCRFEKEMRWSHCSIWEVPLTESPNFPAADRQIRGDLSCVTSRQEFHSLLRCLDFPSSSRLSSRSLGILLLTNGSQDRRIRTNVVKTPDEAAFMLEPQKFLRSHGHRSRSRDLPSVQITGRTP